MTSKKLRYWLISLTLLLMVSIIAMMYITITTNRKLQIVNQRADDLLGIIIALDEQKIAEKRIRELELELGQAK